MDEVERAIRRARVALLQATRPERDAALRAVAELDAVLASMNPPIAHAGCRGGVGSTP